MPLAQSEAQIYWIPYLLNADETRCFRERERERTSEAGSFGRAHHSTAESGAYLRLFSHLDPVEDPAEPGFLELFRRPQGVN